MEGNNITALLARLHETVNVTCVPRSRHSTHFSSFLFHNSVTQEIQNQGKNSEGKLILKNIQ